MERPPNDPTQPTTLGFKKKVVTSMDEGRINRSRQMSRDNRHNNRDTRKEGHAMKQAATILRKISPCYQKWAMISEQRARSSRPEVVALIRNPRKDLVPQTTHNDAAISVGARAGKVVGDMKIGGAEDRVERNPVAVMGRAEGRGTQSESVSEKGDVENFEEVTNDAREHCLNTV